MSKMSRTSVSIFMLAAILLLVIVPGTACAQDDSPDAAAGSDAGASAPANDAADQPAATASNDDSTAAGDGSAAPGDGGAAAGDGGTASGDGSAVAGDGGTAAGDGSAVAGDGGSASGDGSAVAGDGGSASGDGGDASGDGSAVAGDSGAEAGDGGAASGDGGAVAGGTEVPPPDSALDGGPSQSQAPDPSASPSAPPEDPSVVTPAVASDQPAIDLGTGPAKDPLSTDQATDVLKASQTDEAAATSKVSPDADSQVAPSLSTGSDPSSMPAAGTGGDAGDAGNGDTPDKRKDLAEQLRGNVNGTATPAQEQFVVDEAAKLPEPVLQRLVDDGVKLNTCNLNVTNAVKSLSGMEARGYDGDTLDQAGGVEYTVNGHPSAWACTVQPSGESPQYSPLSGSYNTTAHELGHALDETYGGQSATDPSFAHAWAEDYDKLEPYYKTKGDIDGGTQDTPQAALSETYAESFARYVSGDPTMEKELPNLYAYWKNHPLTQQSGSPSMGGSSGTGQPDSSSPGTDTTTSPTSPDEDSTSDSSSII